MNNIITIWLQIGRQQCCLGFVDAEIGKIAVGPPSINHRVRIDASSQRRLWLTESYLQLYKLIIINNYFNTVYIKLLISSMVHVCNLLIIGH